MSAITISKVAKRPVQVGKWVRNGFVPAAEFNDKLAELAGYAASVTTKVVFSHHGSLATGALSSAIPASTGSERSRGRWAWRSGPYAQYLLMRFSLTRQNNGTATNPYVRVRVRSATNSIVGDAFGRGVAATGSTDTPGELLDRVSILVASDSDSTLVVLTPDTDYFAQITEHDYARLHDLVVYEVSLVPDTDNGYPDRNQVAGSPVIASDRDDVLVMARNNWRRGGAHLWNWWADTPSDVRTTSSSTYRNLIDNTSTSTTSAPGVRLNLTNRTRAGRNAVPVVLKVYASDTNGSVRLVDSSGTTMLECTINNGAGWYAVQGTLPATYAKYLLHFGSSGSLTVEAVSLYQCDTFSAWGDTVHGGLSGDLGAMIPLRRQIIVTYTATGSEGTDFMVTLPATLTDAYEVSFFGAAGAASIPDVWDFPDTLAGDRTSTQFRVLVPAALSAGDVFKFRVLI